jgi:hypothetical protein
MLLGARLPLTPPPSCPRASTPHLHVAGTDQPGLRDWYVKTLVPGGEVDFLRANAAAATRGRSLDAVRYYQ